MNTMLKERVKALANEAKSVRLKERHLLANARKLRGKVLWSRKHSVGEPRPEPPVVPQFKIPENPLEKAAQDEYDFFGLSRYRTHVLRKQSRHAQLAYGFLKGNSYLKIETRSKTGRMEPVDCQYLEDLILDYTVRIKRKGFDVEAEMKEVEELFEKFDVWVKDIPEAPQEKKEQNNE